MFRLFGLEVPRRLVNLLLLFPGPRPSLTSRRSFNNLAFPNPEEMARKVKELTGAELMVSLWPSVEDLSENYITLQQRGLLATTRDGTGIHDSFQGVYTRLIDATNPEAREFVCTSTLRQCTV